jgi:hypothetical protein
MLRARVQIYTIKWSPINGRRVLLASASFDATVKVRIHTPGAGRFMYTAYLINQFD